MRGRRAELHGANRLASYAEGPHPRRECAIVDLTPPFRRRREAPIRPIDPEGGHNTYDGWMTAKADYKKGPLEPTGVSGNRQRFGAERASYGTTVGFPGAAGYRERQAAVDRRPPTTPAWGHPETAETPLRPADRAGVKAFKRRPGTEAKTEYFASPPLDARQRGKVRPMVFYVDTTFDARPMPPSNAGLLWNDAFGRTSACRTESGRAFRLIRLSTTTALYNNCVRRTGTSNSELYTASWVDPPERRNPRPTSSCRSIPRAAIQKKLLLTLSAADPEARTTQPRRVRSPTP